MSEPGKKTWRDAEGQYRIARIDGLVMKEGTLSEVADWFFWSQFFNSPAVQRHGDFVRLLVENGISLPSQEDIEDNFTLLPF